MEYTPPILGLEYYYKYNLNSKYVYYSYNASW